METGPSSLPNSSETKSVIYEVVLKAIVTVPEIKRLQVVVIDMWIVKVLQQHQGWHLWTYDTGYNVAVPN